VPRFQFFYHATRTQRICIALYVLLPVVCLSRAGILSKRLNGSGWFLARRLTSAVFNRIPVFSKIGTFLTGTLSQTLKLPIPFFSPRHVDRRVCHYWRSVQCYLFATWTSFFLKPISAGISIEYSMACRSLSLQQLSYLYFCRNRRSSAV